MDNLILIKLLFISFLIFAIKRHLTYLYLLQQLEYNNHRFLIWNIKNKIFDKKLSSIVLIIFLVNNKYFLPNIIIYSLFSIAFIVFGYFENNPITNAKKKLVLTNRAKRIYLVSLIFTIISSTIIFVNLFYFNLFVILLLTIQLIPIYLVLANISLIPIENKIQQNYWQQAKYIINKHKPLVIGISGSYGKTSVKHFLGHILSQTNNTLIIPDSITTMGITKFIRKRLNNNHYYLIAEIGGYSNKAIKKTCDLINPDIGIIVNIGNVHYEYFNNLNNTASAYFELANSVIAKDNNSKIITFEQVFYTDYAKQYINNNLDNFDILYDTKLTNIEQLKTGLSLTLHWQNNNYHIKTPIFGKHQANNIALAFITAYNLGINPDNIIAALKTVPQISHRLEIIKNNNYTLIDDSYNSNFSGFKAGLELLKFLHKPPGRKILITPGLIELGKKHKSGHTLLGETAAQYADLAIVINANRIPSFVDSFIKNANDNQKIIKLSCCCEAKQWLKDNCQDNDTVLLANDVSDLYESNNITSL